MDLKLFQEIYEKSLLANEKNRTVLEKYLQRLEALDFKAYSKKLKVPVLVPIGSRIFFRGELKHTNEVTASLGADYFVKCSVDQAEILKEHRIKNVKYKLELNKKEKDHLESYLTYSKLTANGDMGMEILEAETEEEDKAWRQAHRENVRLYKQKGNADDEEPGHEIPDEELWDRLDELELQEELENELTKDKKEQPLVKPPPAKENSDKDSDDDDDDNDGDKGQPSKKVMVNDAKIENEVYLANCGKRKNVVQQPSKLHLFELVVDRHNALKEMVELMKSKKVDPVREENLLERLDYMEKLEELEDEIEVLEDMLVSDNDDDMDVDEEGDNQIKKSVAFVDHDSETFEVTFKHSDVKPSDQAYDPQMGITKPSDILKAYSKGFNSPLTTSILKKPKDGDPPVVNRTISAITENQEEEAGEENQDSNHGNTIVIRDVVEKVDSDENSAAGGSRPMSLFKKKRQHQKK